MKLHLTEEQRREAQRPQDKPVRLTDPETNQEYVLLPAEAYERVKTFLYDDGDPDPRREYPLVDEVMKADWDDPRMAEYDNYEERRPCK